MPGLVAPVLAFTVAGVAILVAYALNLPWLALAGATDRVRQDLACVVNRYNDPKELNLGLTDAQRVDLVEYLKSL